MPQISVIVPVYKVEPYLCRCVDSILGQSFTDFELILVDDGSPDNCPRICDEYAQKDARVTVVHQANGGLSAARNAGIDWVFANSDSQWITFIDSDDLVHPKYLGLLLNAVEEYGVDVSICGYEETSGGAVEISTADSNVKIWSPEDFYVKYNVNATIAWGKLYRKECFRAIRYPIGKIHEDEFITHRILLALPRVAVIDAPLYNYFVNNFGITKSQWTPKRLDAVEAIKGQVQYMKRNGYREGVQRAIKKYAFNIANHILKLKENNKVEQRKYVSPLRLKLKWILFRYKKIITFKENQWLFELAFPLVMQSYWVGKAQIKKLVRKE